MTLNEFKAWLEGFEASFSPKGAGPDAKQWAAVKAKLEKVAVSAAPSTTPRDLLRGIGWPNNEPLVRFQAPPPAMSAAAPRLV